MSEFNAIIFETEFKKSIGAIAKAEKVTKETLKELSRAVLVAIHATGDISYYNRITAVLTPVNRKVAVLYGMEFTGFMYDNATGLFTKKSKKQYDATADKCTEFLDDPHNNIWSWAARNIDIEAKPLDLKKVTSYISAVMKKAADEGIAQSEVLKAVFAGGVEVDSLIAVMEKMELKANV